MKYKMVLQLNRIDEDMVEIYQINKDKEGWLMAIAHRDNFEEIYFEKNKVYESELIINNQASDELNKVKDITWYLEDELWRKENTESSIELKSRTIKITLTQDVIDMLEKLLYFDTIPEEYKKLLKSILNEEK